MPRYLLIALLGFGAATLALAEEGAAPATEAATECCNTTCPVCGKPIRLDIIAKGFKSEHGPKHPELKDAVIGFDSDECKAKFEKAPEQYEDVVWKQFKEKKVK